MTIRERQAKSIRRKRLGIIEEDNEDDDLREVVFETPRAVFETQSSLRSNIKEQELDSKEIELVTKSTKEKGSATNPDQKLLVRMLGNINICNKHYNNSENRNIAMMVTFANMDDVRSGRGIMIGDVL